MRNLLFFLFLISNLISTSQAFVDVSAIQGIVMQNLATPPNGFGLSFYDFDKDGWDDITFSSTNDSLVIYHNLEGLGFERIETLPYTTSATQPIWVDYDNDGDADVMWTKRTSGTVLYRNDGNMIFTNVTANLNLPATLGVHIYGQGWADYDRDGFLDVYLCTFNSNNNIKNYLLHNNGNGTFTNVAAAAGVEDGLRNTLLCTWQDFNFDNWPDLYVANDYAQGNELYMNNGDGTFTSITAVANLAGNNMNSMSGSICDFDKDHDWDIYVTDGAQGNSFFVNDGNLDFTEEATQLGIAVNSYCWGATWLDFDNDRDEDLHVATATLLANQDFLFSNNGNGTFTNPLYTEFAQDFSFTYASAKGDFNHDGFYDLIVNASGDSLFQLLQNNGSTNNHIKLSLQGTYSNRDAIGTLIEYYIAGEHNMKYTRCGENYLGQNSQHEILSMGEAEIIDSIVITWPRGLVEKFHGVLSNQWLTLVEGENTFVEIIAANNSILCEGTTMLLDGGDWETYLWSNNAESQTIQIETPGIYTVQVTNIDGYSFNSEIEIVNAAAPQKNSITQPITCWYLNNAAITIETDDINNQIIWNDMTADFVRENLGAGTYYFTITNNDNCTATDTIELNAPEEITANVVLENVTCNGFNNGTATINASGGTDVLEIIWPDGVDTDSLNADTYNVIIEDALGCELTLEITIEEPTAIEALITTTAVTCYGYNDGTATITATGGTGLIDVDWMGNDFFALAPNNYSAIIFDENDCETEINFFITQPDSLVFEIATTDVNCFGGNDGTANPNPTGGTLPYLLNWNGADPMALIANDYSATLTDNNGCTAQSTFNINEPPELTATSEHEDVSLVLGSGWASVTPNGGTPPYSYLWSNSDTDSLAEEVSTGTIYCIITDAHACDFLVEIEILFDAIDEQNDLYDFQIFPNPATNLITIKNPLPAPFDLVVIDCSGRVVLQCSNQFTMDVSQLSDGIYYLQFETNKIYESQLFVKLSE